MFYGNDRPDGRGHYLCVALRLLSYADDPLTIRRSPAHAFDRRYDRMGLEGRRLVALGSMRLTDRQKDDLETILYFVPSQMSKVPVTNEDITAFFDYSERGVKRGDEKDNRKIDGYHVLLEGKRWRGIHIHEMWEPGVLEGAMPYFVLLAEMNFLHGWRRVFARVFKRQDHWFEPIPRSVVNFMKKEMFRGIDAEIIERTYQEILSECPGCILHRKQSFRRFFARWPNGCQGKQSPRRHHRRG